MCGYMYKLIRPNRSEMNGTRTRSWGSGDRCYQISGGLLIGGGTSVDLVECGEISGSFNRLHLSAQGKTWTRGFD